MKITNEEMEAMFTTMGFKSEIVDGEKVWTIPPLAECRKIWDRLYGPVRWPDDPNAGWKKAK
jgi:hypothetical protein